MEAWRLGGATEVEARAAALGGDETVRGADAPRRTENGRTASVGTADYEEHRDHREDREAQRRAAC